MAEQQVEADKILEDLCALSAKQIFDAKEDIKSVLQKHSNFVQLMDAYEKRKDKKGGCTGCAERSFQNGMQRALALLIAVGEPDTKVKLHKLLNKKYPNVTHVPILHESGNIRYKTWDEIFNKQPVKTETKIKESLFQRIFGNLS